MILNVKINQERLQEALEVFLKENIGDYISFEEEHEEEAVEALNESTDLHPNDLHPITFTCVMIRSKVRMKNISISPWMRMVMRMLTLMSPSSANRSGLLQEFGLD